MKSISGKDFTKVLKKKGWQLRKIHGSHYVFTKEGFDVRISIPVHGNKPLKVGLLKHLMKITDISEEDF